MPRVTPTPCYQPEYGATSSSLTKPSATSQIAWSITPTARSMSSVVMTNGGVISSTFPDREDQDAELPDPVDQLAGEVSGHRVGSAIGDQFEANGQTVSPHVAMRDALRPP